MQTSSGQPELTRSPHSLMMCQSLTNRTNVRRPPRRIFGLEPRKDVMHRVVIWQRAKKRAGLASSKTVGTVSGTGKKPFPQKGGGRARAGTLRAPHRKGGGVAHGPQPRSFDYTLPKKVRQLGLKHALSSKLAEGKLFISTNLQFSHDEFYNYKEVSIRAPHILTRIMRGRSRLPRTVVDRWPLTADR